MAYDYELATDLIRQVQRAIRAEVGLSHYDPTQKLLPPLPSISESVTSLDPSPPHHLRCKNCKGKLLRGLQSLICIYCGCPNDVVPNLISFKDTFAYRWLLESLQLDGSETVGPPSEKGDLNRGQSTPNVEISLAELLDFKIIWPAEKEKGENVSNKKPVERSYKKLTGIDLDNFFHESRRTDSSNAPEDCPITSNDVVTAEIKGHTTHDNLSFFENVKLSESALQPSTHKNNAAFSGWEADFQYANSGDYFGGSNSPSVDLASALNLHEISKLPEPSSDSTADISSQLDFVFEPAKESKNGISKDGSAASPSISDWTSDHLWNNSKMEASLCNDQPDPTVGVKDALPEANMSNVNLPLQLGSIFGPVKDSKDGNQKEDLATSPSINDWNPNDLWNNVNKEAAPQTEQRDATVTVNDVFPQDNTSNLSTSLDWFQVNRWPKNASAPANNMMSGDKDLFDDWNDFTCSTSVQDSSQTTPTHSHGQFISSSESTSKLNLFSSDNNLEEMDFGSFLHIGPLPRSSSKGSDSSEIKTIGLDVSTPNELRVNNTESDMGEGVGKPATSGDTHIPFDQTREDVELLLSKMHDLAFMLENNLSLPPKSEGVDSFL